MTMGGRSPFSTRAVRTSTARAWSGLTERLGGEGGRDGQGNDKSAKTFGSGVIHGAPSDVLGKDSSRILRRYSPGVPRVYSGFRADDVCRA